MIVWVLVVYLALECLELSEYISPLRGEVCLKSRQHQTESLETLKLNEFRKKSYKDFFKRSGCRGVCSHHNIKETNLVKEIQKQDTVFDTLKRGLREEEEEWKGHGCINGRCY